MNKERRKQIDRLINELNNCLKAFKEIEFDITGKYKRKIKKANMIKEKMSEAINDLNQIY